MRVPAPPPPPARTALRRRSPRPRWQVSHTLSSPICHTPLAPYVSHATVSVYLQLDKTGADALACNCARLYDESWHVRRGAVLSDADADAPGASTVSYSLEILEIPREMSEGGIHPLHSEGGIHPLDLLEEGIGHRADQTGDAPPSQASANPLSLPPYYPSHTNPPLSDTQEAFPIPH